MVFGGENTKKPPRSSLTVAETINQLKPIASGSPHHCASPPGQTKIVNPLSLNYETN